MGWNLKNNKKDKIQAMEIKYLRAILGKIRRDKIENISTAQLKKGNNSEF